MKLEGFLVSVNTTTESTLEIELDASHLDWQRYRNLIMELEDLLHDIDVKYSVKPKMVRGRSIRSKHRRVSKDDRRKTVKFSPFPSKYQNILKNLRAYVYVSLIPAFCFTVERVGNKKVYFLPKDQAPQLLEAIDDLNKNVIENIRREIEEFRKSNEFFAILSLLSSYDMDINILKSRTFYIGNYMLSVTPVDFSYSIDKDELYKNEQMQRHMRGIALLKKSIERMQREYILSMISDIVSKIQQAVAGYTYVRFKNKKLLEKWGELCESTGLLEVKEKIINPLLEVISVRPKERKKKAKEVFGTEDISYAIAEIAKSIIP